jgi:hypothetical protein
LSFTAVNDDGLKSLQSMTKLEDLSLSENITERLSGNREFL